MPPSLQTLARATRVGLTAARTSEEQRRARADERSIAVLVAALLERTDDAVIVGAHHGRLMQQVLASAPAGRHLAVDALPEHTLELQAALPASVIIEQYALTDDPTEGEMELLHVPRSSTRTPPVAGVAGVRVDAKPRRLRARTISLDALVDRHSLIPRLIRIDVDGMERAVLQGARHTIRHYQPVLLVEHGTSLCHGGLGESSESFFDAASALELRVFDLAGRGPYNRDDFAAAVHDRRIVNYLLRH
ncbi:MAG: FkbM family methyltransferase [Patulibacter sp.]